MTSRAGDAPNRMDPGTSISAADAQQVSAALFPTLLIEPAGRILLVNAALLQLLQWPGDFVAGRNVAQLGASPEQAAIRNWLEQLPNLGSLPHELAVRMVRGDGTTVQTKWSVADAGCAQRKRFLVTMIESGSESTTEKGFPSRQPDVPRLEALSLLTADAVHDFKNMLAIITVRSQLAQNLVSEGRPEHAALTEINRTAEEAGRLADRLLELCRNSVGDPRRLHCKAGGQD